MNRFEVDIQVDEAITVAAGTGEQLAAAAAVALTQQGIAPPAAITILLTDDEALRRLNREYRGYDETTDVLSFTDGTTWPDGLVYLGDIAISVPQALRQAPAGEAGLLDELRLLTVHGVLHLLGHDHGEPEEKALMWAAQEEILASLSA